MKSPRGAGNADYLNPRGLRILDALDTVSQTVSASPAEVALAWLMSRKTITAPVASATSAEQMETLVRSAQLELDDASADLLTRASDD